MDGVHDVKTYFKYCQYMRRCPSSNTFLGLGKIPVEQTLSFLRRGKVWGSPS